MSKEKAISVVGLGYVGLPLALEFARKFRVIGFDINKERIGMMQRGVDPSSELLSEAFERVDIAFTCDPEELKKAQFHIVAVPTDIDEHKVPDLEPLRRASQSVGKALKRGDYVVYESTVYPGCTEDECLPILEKESGLKEGKDFWIGYSPERIVPGDKVRTLNKILKIVGANQQDVVQAISKVYGEVIEAGIHEVGSIRVAEAAKVIENTQRDLNISLMNELSIIFSEMGIDTSEVIEAAGTKWNFHKYYPGLVGGHCISVDPYYLLHKARELGHEPKVIAAGRTVNDYMPSFIASKLVKQLIHVDKHPGDCSILVMGVTFKENVSDIRNSKVIDLVEELRSFAMDVDIVDPNADAEELKRKHGLTIYKEIPNSKYDAVVLAVSHNQFKLLDQDRLLGLMKERPILFDLKGVMNFNGSSEMIYWKL
jgi:UDP-N-acetyl-D-galactosamine dehydrogenase